MKEDNGYFGQHEYGSNFKHGYCADCREWKYIDDHSLVGNHRPPYVPLCPNCHRKAEDGKGPYSVKKNTHLPPILNYLKLDEQIVNISKQVRWYEDKIQLLHKQYLVWKEIQRRNLPIDNG